MPLAEHDISEIYLEADIKVSIHVPLAEHDRPRPRAFSQSPVSIHVPLAEHDVPPSTGDGRITVSIHVPLAEHDFYFMQGGVPSWVSIHVPLAEHDPKLNAVRRADGGFNSRAPRGARPRCSAPSPERRQFQFTCPSRSTTCHTERSQSSCQVSIHVPLAEHDVSALPRSSDMRVSIHVPLAEHDGNAVQTYGMIYSFNSRAPRGARLRHLDALERVRGFNSRAPRGARPLETIERRGRLRFQFTCPSRSTT